MNDEARAAYEAWLASQDPAWASQYVEWQNLPLPVREAWNAATQATMGLLWTTDDTTTEAE